MTRVLVVDDDRATTRLLEDVLQDEGYVVDVAANGAAAIDTMPRHPPDVVLVDLYMPVMDGVAFVRACRDDPRWSGLRIVLLSAQTHGAAEGGWFDAVVPKPFHLSDLLRAVSVAPN
jgi:CheY-like chemotaxis protein